MEKRKYIGMFGSSRELGPDYTKKVEDLFRLLAENRFDLMHGAGSTGMMGAAARGCKKGNGKVFGVVPDFMSNFEPLFEDCDETVLTEDMEVRKKIIKKNAAAFLVTPGGIGTMDEFFEILTDKYLRLHNKPIVLFNVNGFFNSLVAMLTEYHKVGSIGPSVFGLFRVMDDPEEILGYFQSTLGGGDDVW